MTGIGGSGISSDFLCILVYMLVLFIQMSLQLIVGCMFSGKSTELIRRIRRFQSIGKRVMVVNHTLDNRDGSSNVLPCVIYSIYL